MRQPYNHRQDICSPPVYTWWGISDSTPEAGGASARRYAAQNKQLGYRVYLVGYLWKVSHSKVLREDREKLAYR